VATTGYNVGYSGKYACKIHQDPYANLLSANYGLERSGGFQMPLRSRMTSYEDIAVRDVSNDDLIWEFANWEAMGSCLNLLPRAKLKIMLQMSISQL
jgi:hypothetical protein